MEEGIPSVSGFSAEIEQYAKEIADLARKHIVGQISFSAFEKGFTRIDQSMDWGMASADEMFWAAKSVYHRAMEYIHEAIVRGETAEGSLKVQISLMVRSHTAQKRREKAERR